MDVNYFKSQIQEELEGARTYIDKAIEAKINHPAWSRQFVLMADMEAEHAATLMKMMESCLRTTSKVNTKVTTIGSTEEGVTSMMSSNRTDSVETVYKDLMKEFGETMTYVTNMKRGL